MAFHQTMSLRFAAIAVVAATASFRPVTASAQTPEQVNWCDGKDSAGPRLRLGACTAIINSGKFAGKDLAVVYVKRGTAFRLSDNDKAAVADYTEAIQLDPNNVDAFYYRAYANRGDRARAMADYDAVIRLDPKHTGAFYSRGFGHHQNRDYDRAIADYNEAIRTDTKTPTDRSATAATRISAKRTTRAPSPTMTRR